MKLKKVMYMIGTLAMMGSASTVFAAPVSTMEAKVIKEDKVEAEVIKDTTGDKAYDYDVIKK